MWQKTLQICLLLCSKNSKSHKFLSTAVQKVGNTVLLIYKVTSFPFGPFADSSMDSNARIALIQQNMKNLKKAYQSLKTKLATTERQIKKIRRKEREKTDIETKSTAIEASA